MSESFAQLFEESLSKQDMRLGSILKGTVVAVNDDNVIVNVGLKSEGTIPIEQFKSESGELTVKVGDEVDVALDAIEDGFGETKLSREKAKRSEAWIVLKVAFEGGQTVTGTVNGRVKGGFTVEIGNIRAFLPGSLIDMKPVKDPSFIEGKTLEFKIIKLDQKRNNVVVSRRSAMLAEGGSEQNALLEKLQEGETVNGVFKNFTDYGAFVDLGGVDGLLHITDIAWKRVKHPAEVLTIGQELRVKILKFDREKMRVSLGLKQLGDDPWAELARRYPKGTRLTGKVTNITDYGCFVEIENGVEGLVHVSEMDWTNKNIHPAKVVQLGEEVEVMVLDIDEERRRISLGIKQCKNNPWELFSQTHAKGDVVKGKIKSITDFGVFIGLDGNIDGLVHLSDISWNVAGEEAVRSYKKGDELTAVVLAVDPERERISLGIKQLEGDGEDSFTKYATVNKKNSVVKGTVIEVDAKGAKIDLGEGVEGYVRVSDISRERLEDARTVLKSGESIEAKLISVDRKARLIHLSIKAKDSQDEAEALQHYSKQNEPSATLGDLIKGQLGHKE
ncbi:MAG TPA: 30S ribosomal protein S1 [Gammaproteobacteria bacterium]|nr:30S ribosomal protein S1 [Gammaproteobacteria bacterium]